MGNSMILTVGAILLFGVFLLSANRLILTNSNTADEAEFAMTAVSLAQSLISEAKGKVFDQQAIASPPASRAALTLPALLGRDGASESVPNPDTLNGSSYGSLRKFNDLDDYHTYRRVVNTSRAEGYEINSSVQYVSESYPDSVKNVQTYAKRLRVTVTSPFLSFPVSLSYTFTL